MIHVPFVRHKALKILLCLHSPEFVFSLCIHSLILFFISLCSTCCEILSLCLLKSRRVEAKKSFLSLLFSLHVRQFPDSSSLVVVKARSPSVAKNLLYDKEAVEGLAREPSPDDSKFAVQNLVTRDKSCVEFESERESEPIYAPVESFLSQNNFYSEYQSGDFLNWPYDLSRTSATAKTKTVAGDHYSQLNDANYNFRNPCNQYAGAMKGNLIALCQINDYPSPPSSVSSSSSNDYNNNSFINIEQAIHLSTIDDVIREELKRENYFLVEDATAGSYTTLTNATAQFSEQILSKGNSTTPLDLYHLHDYTRNYSGTHNHNSTSSGGDSRSPDGYNNEDYENGIQSFTQLTPRSNGIYSASPNAVSINDHNILYDSAHVLSPTR